MSDVASKTFDLTSHKPRTALAFVSDQESEESSASRSAISDCKMSKSLPGMWTPRPWPWAAALRRDC